MLGSRVSLDRLAEWIEQITNNVQRLGAYLSVRLGSFATVNPAERVHALVLSHQQLDGVLSEIEANLF